MDNKAAIYLFDWGDTLMVDLPNQAGKMCDWPQVIAVNGAYQVLEQLSKEAKIYIATNAAESSPEDIKKAFQRVDLAKFISGYFCRANLGLDKGSAGFYQAILTQLKIPNDQANQVTMVGDTFDNDTKPALDAGLNAIWLNHNQDSNFEQKTTDSNNSFKVIQSLTELLLS